ncbi:MAG: FAD-dependent oxidoreductase [Bacteroidales bacterium]|nr:FAD-dependent oxidoreductase [Bacteroidales bacterium]
MKHVIIGGVAGGATAAARIRRIDENCEIVLIDKGHYISYANCGLPYYIGDVINDKNKLFVQTAEKFSKRFNIDVRVDNEVISIDSENKNIIVKKQDGSCYVETYDKLLLSPGSYPVKPPLKGIDLPGIFTLRNVEDTDRIKSYIKNNEIKRAVVVGGGFIGLEMAENLHSAGAKVSVIEMANQVMASVDYSIASHVHSHLIEKGVNLYLDSKVESFEKDEKGIEIKLASSKSIFADIIILSIGVRPAVSLAKDAGIEIGETGGIRVSNYLETSKKDIYAVGDAIEFPNPITGRPWLNYLANPANRQARIVADNMVFENIAMYEGAIGTSVAKVFDLTVASTGLAAKKLKQLDIPYLSSTIHSNSHAGYYPDALPITIKTTFDPKDGRLYGVQSVGYSGVDKRIDEASIIIKNGGTVYDLIRLEHTYAPPFSSAKDPLAIAGYVSSNILAKKMPIFTWREVDGLIKNSAFILDVRTKAEFELGSIKGSYNIPLDDLRDRMIEIPYGETIYVYCAVGLRGYLAMNILNGKGFADVKNLSGGFKTYSLATQEIVNKNCQVDIIKNNDDKLSSDNKEYDLIENNAVKVNPIKECSSSPVKTISVDACGLQCPGPILKLKESIETINEGEVIEILSTDAAFARDAGAWCAMTGNIFLGSQTEKGKYRVKIKKGKKIVDCLKENVASDSKGKTFIMFSDDLDKALATFILANGAAVTGEKVTIFFTFWGLNVIKKTAKPKVEKDIFAKMFSFMLPSDSFGLKLSKFNMFGMGSNMMRYIMNKKGIESLESLRASAIANNVEFIACQMSMDVMGISKEELLDEVTIGGVATYMEKADKANVNLFI